MSIYLGEIPLANNNVSRNIGEIVASTLPITDAGLHLLDGSLISGYGSYSAFVAYIANLYSTAPKYSDVKKYGSLTDSDGVLSGFSSSNYAAIFNVNIGTADTWEQVWKVTTPNDVSSSHYINSGLNAICHDFGYVDGIWKMFLSSNGTSWNIVNGATNNVSVSTNTTYLVKLEFTGTAYNMLVSTDNGGTWTTVATYSSSTKVYSVNSFKIGNTYDAFWVWSGSIDLNGSYININGSRWWTGRMPECFTDEGQWQSSVTSYGVCGKFVYDSVNNTVRLPKITGFTEGTIDPTVLGDLTQAGLPNITGKWTGTFIEGRNPTPQGSGAFSNMVDSTDGSYFGGAYRNSPNWNITASGGEGYTQIDFDASRSSSIYGNSSTVQPQSIKVFYYIVIASSITNELNLDVADLERSKADVDLSNVNASGTSLASGWSMPSSRYIDLTLGASGSHYIAPANGWFTCACTGNLGDSFFELVDPTGASATASYAGGWARATIPVRKGVSIDIYYGGTNFTKRMFGFYYAEGEN